MPVASHDRLEQYRVRYAQLRDELLTLGFVCVGSLQRRHLPCGKDTCHCHEHPDNRHGPYHYWTRKVAAKTVAVLVPAQDVAVYNEWLANNRTLDRIVREMREISARALTLTLAAARKAR